MKIKINMCKVKTVSLLCLLFIVFGCSLEKKNGVRLSLGKDISAGRGPCYIITTPAAKYYLDKKGGGLSSMIDNDSIDWLGFHSKKGTAHKGEYRGFPNAIHKQDGSYFHAMNAGTNPSSSHIVKNSKEHIRITFTSENNKWKAQWNFFANRCDFTMTKISKDYHYWVQYEGVPNGKMDSTDFWFASVDDKKHPINEPFLGDLPAPEWMAFGDENSSRTLFMLHHEDDTFQDNYVSRPDMTVFGFGRHKKEKYLNTKQHFSIGFIESTDYGIISKKINNVIEQSTN